MNNNSEQVLVDLSVEIKKKRNFISKLNETLKTVRDPNIEPKARYPIPTETEYVSCSVLEISCDYGAVDVHVKDKLTKARKELIKLCKKFTKEATSE
jgi:hypothetical protein